MSMSACGGNSARTVESLDGAAFEERTKRICMDHGKELDELFDPSSADRFESDMELEAEIERTRRRLLALRRGVLAALRQVEPLGREVEWRLALNSHEAAIDRAGRGDRVDVHGEDLADSVSGIVDGFEFDECF